MAKKSKPAAAKRYHGRIASLPCALCSELGQPQESPTTVHHIRAGQGMAQRAGHFLVLPLCYQCRQGKHGIHGDRALWRVAGVSELDLLARIIERLADD